MFYNKTKLILKANNLFSYCDFNQALNYYLKIEDKDLEIDTLLKIAQCYLKLELFDKAIKSLEKILNYCIKNNEIDKAIAICKKIINIDPENTEALLILAKLLKSSGLIVDAAKYYRIVVKHYELSGFNNKVVEIVQILKEMGQCSIDDAINMAVHEYHEGALEKFKKNIYEIINDLKKGHEHFLLEKAYKLSLMGNKKDFNCLLELSTLYFHTGNLYSCLKISYFALFLYPRGGDFWLLLVKALYALKHKKLSLELIDKIKNKKILLDHEEFLHLFDRFLQKLKTLNTNVEKNSSEVSYLKESNFTTVDHELLAQKIKDIDSSEHRIENVNVGTEIFDKDRKLNFPIRVSEDINSIELFMAEGLYDRALDKLSVLIKEYPSVSYLRNLFLKCNYFSGHKQSADIKILKDNESLSSQFYEFSNDLDSTIDLTYIDSFHKLVMKFVEPDNKNMIYDLAIFYFEMKIWTKAYELFKILGGDLGVSPIIYKVYSYHMFSEANDDKYLEELKALIDGSCEEDTKCEALYYFALIFEHKNKNEKALNLYNKIIAIKADYRDVEIRINLMGT